MKMKTPQLLRRSLKSLFPHILKLALIDFLHAGTAYFAKDSPAWVSFYLLMSMVYGQFLI
jgi:uncharacterized membrane protein (DUF106 family)